MEPEEPGSLLSHSRSLHVGYCHDILPSITPGYTKRPEYMVTVSAIDQDYILSWKYHDTIQNIERQMIMKTNLVL